MAQLEKFKHERFPENEGNDDADDEGMTEEMLLSFARDLEAAKKTKAKSPRKPVQSKSPSR